jgi:hypothetical protein
VSFKLKVGGYLLPYLQLVYIFVDVETLPNQPQLPLLPQLQMLVAFMSPKQPAFWWFVLGLLFSQCICRLVA